MYILFIFIKKQLRMAITVVGRTIGVPDYYGTKLKEKFKTYKTAHFNARDIRFLEWR